MPSLPDADRAADRRAATCRGRPTGARPASRTPTEPTPPRIIAARCVSTSSPAPPSRSGSTSCGRSPSGSSATGSPGFGWGAAWVGARRAAAVLPRHPRLPRRPGSRGGRADETTAALVHLRRPSKLSTLTLPDTQPFDDPAGRFAFSHNGDLRDYRALRDGVPRRRAASTAGPTPRSARAGSRTRGGPDEPVADLLTRPPRPVRRAGQPRRPDRRTRAPTTTPATTRTRSSRSGSADRRRVDGHLLARPVALPVRRPGRHRRAGSSGSARPSRSTVTGTRQRRHRMRRGAASLAGHVSRSKPMTVPSDTSVPARPADGAPGPDGRPGRGFRPRAGPDLALLARPVVDLRRSELDHRRAVSSSPTSWTRPRLDERSSSSRSAAWSSRSSSSRRSARSATTRSRAGAGASRTSSSGRSLDVVFLIGIASSNTLLAIAAFVALLQFSSNFAQGPFQGYVPDLVPAPQVGTGQRARRADAGPRRRRRASSSARLATATHNFAVGLIALGVLELVTMLLGRLPRSRGPRSPSRARAVRGARSPPRRGAPTSSGSTASCGWSPRAWPS